MTVAKSGWEVLRERSLLVCGGGCGGVVWFGVVWVDVGGWLVGGMFSV